MNTRLEDMKPICQACGETYRGIALNAIKEGKQLEVCPSCYKTLDAAYRSNSCLACVFFHIGDCELYNTELEEPYLQNTKCDFFTTSKDPAIIADLKQRAEAVRNSTKEKTAPTTLEELISEMGRRGQVLTYFCCHCGTPLKISIKTEIQKNCPQCKNDLSAIDLKKLISQHI
jgi:hypothetical protein